MGMATVSGSASSLVRSTPLVRSVLLALTAAMGLAAAAPALAAQQPSAPAPPAGPGEGAPRVRLYVVNAPSDAVTARWDPAAGVWEFSPPAGATVQVEWGEWHLKANRARWDPSRQLAQLEGDVVASRPDLETFSPRLTVQASERVAVLSGGVRLVQYRADRGRRGGRLRSIEAQELQLDDRNGLLEARGQVQVVQDEPAFQARADRLVFDQSRSLAVLTADAGVSGEAQGYRLTGAPRLEYHVETGELVLYGPASIQQLAPVPGR